MATGPFEIRKSLELPSGDILYRDQSIRETTKSVIDAASTWAGGNLAAYPEGTQIKNLCYVDDYAESKVSSWSSTPAGAGGGIVYPGGAKGLKLPASFYPGAATDFIATVWFKFPASGIVSTLQPNHLLFIGSGDGNNFALSTFKLYAVMDSAFKMTGLGLVLFGTLQSVPAAVLSAITLGAVTQLSVRVTFNSVSAKWLPTFYVNGKPVATGSEVAAIFTDAPDQAWAMGHQPGGFSLVSTFYRARLDVMGDSTLTPDEVVSADYNLNKAFYS